MKNIKKRAQSEEVDTLLQTLMGVSTGPEAITNLNSTSNIVYQLPIKIGKEGRPISEGDHPWVVGTFAPKQYVNETHPQGHEGIDLKAPKGTPVYPIGPGVVMNTQSNPNGGQTVKISHEEGHVTSYYAHLSEIFVSQGQTVTPTTPIGAVGDTGNAKGRGAHLHYEVSVDNKKIDPNNIINKTVGSVSQQKQAKAYLQILKILNSISY